MKQDFNKKILLVLISINLILPNVVFGDFFIPYVNISGQVKDVGTNQAIQGAKVFFEPDWRLLPPPPFFSNDINTTTNEFGKYFFQFSFPPDKGNIIVSSDGYEENRAGGIELPMYSTVEVNFEMKPEQELEPVILVPGIMGSYLNKADNGKEVWPNIDRMFLSWDDDYLDKLILPLNGEPEMNNIIPGDIIRKISDNDFFKSLITELKNNGYKENVNLFVFPYDWRRDINYLAGIGATIDKNTLVSKVSDILSVTGADKVDIIAHSMGGLIAKAYMKNFGTSKINKFIDIATPHLGAPKAAKILMYGDDMGMSFLKLGLDQEKAKIISQNMPAVYQLLPSRLYFNERDKDYGAYLADIFDIDNNGIMGNLDYEKSMNLLNNTGRNIALTYVGGIFHDNIDNYFPKNNGVDTYNIVGCGMATIGKIYALNKEKSGGNEYAIRYINGDGTVPVKSAEYLQTINEFYVRNSNHASIPSVDGARKLVAEILRGGIDNFNFSNFNDLSLNKNNNFCSLNGIQISYHSPIDLHIYDEQGNHVGPTENGDLENNIPGVEYDILDDNKFAFLPKGKNYKIKGEAMDVGIFNARIQKIENGEYIKTAYFNEVILNSTSTKTYFEINSSITDYNQIKIQIDEDGDNIFEKNIGPDSILTGEQVADVKKPETKINIIGEKENEISEYYLDSVSVELTAEDNINGSGILKTEYSLDNGKNWEKYEELLTLTIPRLSTTTEMIYSIEYSSSDRAGNRENEKEEIIKIKKLITIDSIISNINELYNQGEIREKKVKNKLIKKLKQIKKKTDKYNKKSDKKEEKFKKRLMVCEKNKNQEKCQEKTRNIFNKINDRLIGAREKIIKHKLKKLFKTVDFYYKKEWISEFGYDILRVELNYLLNNQINYDSTK